MPEANEMVVGIMAVVAEAERKMISERTKVALQAAKKRGVKLGGFRGHKVDGRLGTEAKMRKAEEWAMYLKPILEDMEGMSLNKIADELNRREVPTRRGGMWQAVQVKRVLERLA